MARLTQAGSDGYVVPMERIRCGPDGAGGEAIARLAAFEDFADDLQKQQQELADTLDRLRREGKERSVQFRELLGKKLMNAHLLAQLQARGLMG